jgi:hypothetical protein
VIFAGIEVRGRPGSPLKINRIFRDRSVRFEGADFEDRGFRPDL